MSARSKVSQSPKPARKRAINRRSLPGNKRKSLRVHMTEDEFTKVRTRAANHGISMSRLLVSCVVDDMGNYKLGRDDIVALYREVRNLRRQVIGIAININQIAHHANSVSAATEEQFIQAINANRRALQIMSGSLDELFEQLSK